MRWRSNESESFRSRSLLKDGVFHIPTIARFKCGKGFEVAASISQKFANSTKTLEVVSNGDRDEITQLERLDSSVNERAPGMIRH